MHRATATSVTQTGLFAGNSVGPLCFGILVTHAGFETAWATAAAAMALGACLVLISARLMRPRPAAQPHVEPAEAPPPLPVRPRRPRRVTVGSNAGP